MLNADRKLVTIITEAVLEAGHVHLAAHGRAAVGVLDKEGRTVEEEPARRTGAERCELVDRIVTVEVVVGLLFVIPHVLANVECQPQAAPGYDHVGRVLIPLVVCPHTHHGEVIALLAPGQDEQLLASKIEGLPVPAGSTFLVRSGGGGGWGPPGERDPAARRTDIENEFISATQSPDHTS